MLKKDVVSLSFLLHMLFLFVSAVFSKRPVILVPPIFGSQLSINATNFRGKWYCESNVENQIVWLDDKFVIPPLYNCLADYLTSEWDPVENRIKNRTNVEVFTQDFGGEAAIRYVDSGLFGYTFIAILANLIDALHDLGYETRKDLFGAPYDWRNAPHNLDYYYPKLKALIEEAYTINNEKVCVFSYSCGCMVTHYFLTKYVDQAWKDKYIQKVIWSAASIGGSMDATQIAYDHTIDYFPSIFNTEIMGELFQTTMTISAHLPNFNVYPDVPLIFGPNGEEYTAKQIPEWLKAAGKVDEKYERFFNFGLQNALQPIADPGVNSYFAFNTGIDTLAGLNFSAGWDKEPTKIYTPGDSTMDARALYYGCNHWGSANKGKTLLCHDFNLTGSDYTHVTILTAPQYLEAIIEIIDKDNWLLPGRHNVTGTQAPNFFD